MATKLTDQEREAIATARALAVAVAPALLEASDGEVAQKLAQIAVEINAAAIDAVAS